MILYHRQRILVLAGAQGFTLHCEAHLHGVGALGQLFGHLGFFLVVALNQEDALLGVSFVELEVQAAYAGHFARGEPLVGGLAALVEEAVDQGRRFVAGDLLGHNQVGHLLDFHSGLHLKVDAVAVAIKAVVPVGEHPGHGGRDVEQRRKNLVALREDKRQGLRFAVQVRKSRKKQSFPGPVRRALGFGDPNIKHDFCDATTATLT